MFDRSQIDRFSAGGQQLREAVAGLNQQKLTAFPIPGTWSIHQIVVHLMDSDLVMTDRMKRTIAMDNPLLTAFDESAYIQRLSPHALPVEQCIGLFDQNRQLMATILRHLPDEAFDRAGTHNERGRITLAEQLAGSIDHLEHHLRFIQKKRAMV